MQNFTEIKYIGIIKVCKRGFEMEKTNNKLVIDYINGEDIENIEALENDFDFMKAVIDKSNDKNFYNLCSNDLKINHDFVLYLIYKFSDNKSFITEVVDYYLFNNDYEDSFYNLDIIVLAANLINDDKHRVLANTVYNVERIKTEVYKVKETDQEKKNFVGLGFILIFDQYHGNKMVLDYYAKRLMFDIFRDNGIDLEGLLHKHFKTPQELIDMGVKTFLINFIESFDSMLASYVSTHTELLEEYNKKVEKIIDKWKKYDEVTEIRKYNKILDVIHDYMENADSVGTLTEDEVLYYVGNKFGIMDKLHYYDTLNVRSGMDSFDLQEDEDYKNEYIVDEEIFEDSIKSNFANKMILLNVEKMVSEILYPTAPTEEEIEAENNLGKVTKLEFKKANN